MIYNRRFSSGSDSNSAGGGLSRFRLALEPGHAFGATGVRTIDGTSAIEHVSPVRGALPWRLQGQVIFLPGLVPGVLAFAQLTYRASLRDIQTSLRAHSSLLYHMGIRGGIAPNTLAHRNRQRISASNHGHCHGDCRTSP